MTRRLRNDLAGSPTRRNLWLAPAGMALAVCALSVVVLAQAPEFLPPPAAESLPAPQAVARETVVDVRIDGAQQIPLQRIAPHVLTRVGRPYDPEMVEEDVRRLNKSRMFVTVRPLLERLPEGVVVIFQVVERPTVEYVKYVGSSVRRRHLDKRTLIKAGDVLDPYQVEEGRRKVEEYYLEKGYSKATVTVIEGNKPGDRGVVYLVNEGNQQKVWRVEFVGNTIASDARLRTIIKSKPPILYIFKGFVDREKIDQDLTLLTAYYRSLGFFGARIGRELEYNEAQKWLTLRFVIDEGPRYVVRNVSVIGNEKFSSEQLLTGLKLNPGQYFNQSAMVTDVGKMKDVYGCEGYIFADVLADPRFLEEPGQLDLVYQIDEGQRYRVGKIDVRIDGEDPRTRRNTVLNRVSIYPGEIVDIRKLRDSERRLQASGLFLVNPQQGITPKIVFERPDPITGDRQYAKGRGNTVRGQSPDGYQPDQLIDLVLDGQLLPEADEQASRPPAWQGWFRPVQQLFAPRQAAADPQPIDPTTVRYQSPGGYGGYAPPGEVYGQVPLQSTGPSSAPSQPWRPGGQPLNDPQLVPVQYTAPAPNQPVNAPPNYGQPPGGYPGPPPANSPYNPYANPPSATPGQFTAQPLSPSVPPQVFSGPPGYDDPNQLRGGEIPGLIPPWDEPQVIDPTIVLNESQTGRFMVGVGVNSDAGVVGSIVLDEQNFDFLRFPRSWDDVLNGTAFRGAGQQFRIEAVPGNQVSRYMIDFREPYLFDTRVSLGLSGFYFTRFYRDWDEERTGGRVSLGYMFTPDLSGSVAFRGENVNISRPRLLVPDLVDVLGDNALYTVRAAMAHDTRDNTFLATTGHRVEVGFEQGFGDFTFPKVTLEGRQHFMLHERPDGSGRHVLSLVGNLGFAGDNTPVFERFYAGGFSTMRGFDFRGASPLQQGVIVGGQFQWLNTVEYLFPISADDMLRGVVFCDFGTVEREIALNSRNFRVAPGFGLRITVPAMGPAPIALDFAVPVVHADGDDLRNFSFFIGFGR